MAARDPQEARYSPAVRCMFHRYKSSRHNLTMDQFVRMGVVRRMTGKKLAPMTIRVKNPSGLVNFSVDAEDDQWYPKLCNEVAEVLGKTHRVDLTVDDCPLSQLKLGELMALSKRPRRVLVVHQENYPLHAIQIKRVSKAAWLPKHHAKGMQKYDVHTRALMMNMTRELARRIYDRLFATERSKSVRVSYADLYRILTSVMCSDDLYADTPVVKDERARSGRAYVLFFKSHGIRNVPKRQDAVLKKLVRALNKHQYHRKRVGVAIKRSNVRVPENECALREQPGWDKMSNQQRDVQRLLTKVGIGHMLLAKSAAPEPVAVPALCFGIKGAGPEVEPPQRAYASDSDEEGSSDSDGGGEDVHGMTMVNIGRRYHGATVWHAEGRKTVNRAPFDHAFVASAIPDSEPIARKYHGAASVTVVKGGARVDGVNSGFGRAFIAAPMDGGEGAVETEEWAGSDDEKREVESLWDASDVVQEVGALADGSGSDSDYEPLSMEDDNEGAQEVGEAVGSGEDMKLLVDSEDEARAIGEPLHSDDEYELVEEEDASDVSFADTDGEEEVMTLLKNTAQSVSAGIMSDDDEDTAFFNRVMEVGQEVDDEFADDDEDDDGGMEAAFAKLEEARRRDIHAGDDMDDEEEEEEGEEEDDDEEAAPAPMFDFTSDDGGDGFVMNEMSVVGASMFEGAPAGDWKDSCDHILPGYPDRSSAQRVDVTTGVINGGLKGAVVAGHDAGHKMRLYVPTNAAWKAYQDATGFGPEACSARARWNVPFVRRAGDVSAVGKMLKGFRYVADRKVKQRDGSSVYELPLVPDMASAAMMGALRRELECKRVACSASGLRKKIDAYTQTTLQSALADTGARVINTDALYADLTSSSYDEGDPRAGAASFMSVYEFLAYSGQIDTAGGRLVFAMSNSAWEDRYAKFVKTLLQRSQWAKKLRDLIANHVARVHPESDAFLVRKGRQYLVKTDASPARYVLFDSSKVRGRKKDALKFVSYDVESSFGHPALATTSVIVSNAPYTVFLAVSEENAKKIYNFSGHVTTA